MQKHVTLVAAFHIGYGVLGILGAVIIWALVVRISSIAQNEQVPRIVSVVTNVAAFALVFIAIPGMIGGFGLLKRQSWARILVLIISVLYLIRIPVGTALGVYSIWALLNEETRELFASGPGS